MPSEVAEHQTTKAYYRVIETLTSKLGEIVKDEIANFALKVDEIVKNQEVKDWHLGTDIEKKIIGSIEVEIFYPLEDKFEVTFTDDEMKEITDNLMLIAKRLDYR